MIVVTVVVVFVVVVDDVDEPEHVVVDEMSPVLADNQVTTCLRKPNLNAVPRHRRARRSREEGTRGQRLARNRSGRGQISVEGIVDARLVRRGVRLDDQVVPSVDDLVVRIRRECGVVAEARTTLTEVFIDVFTSRFLLTG